MLLPGALLNMLLLLCALRLLLRSGLLMVVLSVLGMLLFGFGLLVATLLLFRMVLFLTLLLVLCPGREQRFPEATTEWLCQ